MDFSFYLTYLWLEGNTVLCSSFFLGESGLVEMEMSKEKYWTSVLIGVKV